MIIKTALIFAIALSLDCASFAQPSSANSISFQGALTGTNGQPLPNGNYSLTFKFYDVPTGGTALATSNVPNVPVTGGIASTPIPVEAAWFNGQTRYLGISINGGAELAPRVMVTAVPYAISANQLQQSVLVGTNGNVGIGTATPNSSAGHTPTLHIEGFSPGIKLRDVEPADASAYEMFVNGGGLSILDNGSGLIRFKISASGDIGIGTEMPNSSVGHTPTLHIEGSSPGIKLRDTDPDDPAGFEIYVNGQHLSILNNANAAVPFQITPDNLTRVKAIQITGGADLAEHLNVNRRPPDDEFKVEPGMVVSIDPSANRKFKLADEVYDRKRVGIISGGNGVQPGLVLRDAGNPQADGEQPIALTGQVWCHADAAFGPITPGDLLTTSSTPGHAMRVSDDAKARFAVLGQALTGLAEGRGWVQVLVGKQ